MEQGMKDKVERIKAKAELFLVEKIKAFVVDVGDNYYFCDIKYVGQNSMNIVGFAGHRKNQEDKIFFVDILRFEEYEELEEKK